MKLAGDGSLSREWKKVLEATDDLRGTPTSWNAKPRKAREVRETVGLLTCTAELLLRTHSYLRFAFHTLTHRYALDVVHTALSTWKAGYRDAVPSGRASART